MATTAHKSTWKPAVAKPGLMGNYSTGGQVSKQYSARDVPAQLSLKAREQGQGTAEENAKRDFRAELEEKERKHFEKKRVEGKAAGR